MSPAIDPGAIGPVICVALGVGTLPLLQIALERKRSLLGRTLTRDSRGTYVAAGGMLFLGAALILALIGFERLRVFNPDLPMVAADAVASFLGVTVLGGALLTVLISPRYLASSGSTQGEYYALLLASVAGMLLVCSATHLLAVFVALELVSLPLYALVGLKRSLRSGEAAFKFFLTGAVASAAFLYGSALLYGATGELGLRAIGAALDPEDPVVLAGIALLLASVGTRVAAVPFHQWLPDTFQGAPTSVTVFMATAARVAAFAVLVRLSAATFPALEERLAPVFWALAAVSILLGNLMALLQRDLKRLLAWSGVAHGGYVLVGILVGGPEGLAAVLFYLLVYTLMALGAFASVATLTRDGGRDPTLTDLAGLSRTQPFVAVCFSVCALSLIGVPGTAGFIAKLQLVMTAVSRAVSTGDGWLLGIAAIVVGGSALSAASYLRLPGAMFMGEPPAPAEESPPGTLDRIVLLVCAIGCLILGLSPHDALPGLYPLDVLRLADLAAASLY